jgi:hypothetical protein
MAALLPFRLGWLELALGVAVLAVVGLAVLLRGLWAELQWLEGQFEQVERERDEAQEVLEAIRRMAGIRAATVARMRDASR